MELCLSFLISPPPQWKYLDVKLGAYPMDFTLDTERVLFATSNGNGLEDRYKYVDCASGETLWEILYPGEADAKINAMPQVALLENSILFACLERGGSSIYPADYRAVYVVDIMSGKTTARWRANSNSTDGDLGRFFVKGTRTFLVYRDEFTEIKWPEVVKEMHHWKWEW